MTLTMGDAVASGDTIEYLNLKEKAQQAGPEGFVAIFRIRQFMAPVPGDYGYPTVPVVTDVLIASGAHAGKVFLAEEIRYAPTAQLRGVPNPNQKNPEVLAPTRQSGEQLVYTVKMIAKKGSAAFVGLNPPTFEEGQAAEKVYANGAGWNVMATEPEAVQQPQVIHSSAVPPALPEQRQPAMAGAPAPVVRRPFG